jgi:hypothetical protein
MKRYLHHEIFLKRIPLLLKTPEQYSGDLNLGLGIPPDTKQRVGNPPEPSYRVVEEPFASNVLAVKT